jgi:flagellar biosynthetic protein FliR
MTVANLMGQFGEQHVAAFILVLARVSPLFVLAPMFSSKMVPARVRGIIAVALAIGLSPVVAKGVTLPTGVMDMTWLVLKEMLVGGAFAFAVGGLAAALSAAGSFIDTSIGFSYGSLVDPLTGTQSTVLAQAYSLVGMLIFIAIGGDGWVVQGLARTYDMVGLDQAPALGRLVGGVDAVVGSIFISAIEVAGPVLLALILTDAAFGVVSRVVPQLNVFAVGFPAKVVVGLLLVTATLPFVAGWISSELQQDVGAALQAIRVA